MIIESVLIAALAISSAQPTLQAGLERLGKSVSDLNEPDLLAFIADTPSAAAQAVLPQKPQADSATQSRQPTNEDIPLATEHPTPRITVVDPPRQAPPWDWKDRIAWGANIVLVLLGYAGIMMALSLLRKIERQSKYFEEAVAQAKTAADAALLHAEALVRAERPWVMITVERSPTVENGSVVVATNRGKSPAKLIATTDRIMSAADEQHLPAKPEYGEVQASPLAEPIILLPGECAEIRIFGDEDVERYCTTEAQRKRVEQWEERLFVYGKVTYKDLIAPAGDRQVHESSWCCWYVVGKNTRGLVAVNVPAFRELT